VFAAGQADAVVMCVHMPIQTSRKRQYTANLKPTQHSITDTETGIILFFMLAAKPPKEVSL
jgi:hypothetical protein